MAFSDTASVSSSMKIRDDVNRKATIVIEHLIQASDVSHTMQHWEVYREWNKNLLREMYQAYQAGRAATHFVRPLLMDPERTLMENHLTRYVRSLSGT